MPCAASGSLFSLATNSDGQLFSWGLHHIADRGEGDSCSAILGHGGEDEIASLDLSKPQPIEALRHDKIVAVAASGSFVMALTEEGGVFSWGFAEEGEDDESHTFPELGHGDDQGLVQRAPKLIAGLQDAFVLSIAAGDEHCLALVDSGEVFSWGFGASGQLGHTQDSISVPTLVPFPETKKPVAAIAAGVACSGAVCDDGSVFTWGNGRDGRLGHGNQDNAAEPRLVPSSAFHGCAVTSLSMSTHSLAVTSTGELYSWGNTTR